MNVKMPRVAHDGLSFPPSPGLCGLFLQVSLAHCTVYSVHAGLNGMNETRKKKCNTHRGGQETAAPCVAIGSQSPSLCFSCRSFAVCVSETGTLSPPFLSFRRAQNRLHQGLHQVSNAEAQTQGPPQMGGDAHREAESLLADYG